MVLERFVCVRKREGEGDVSTANGSGKIHGGTGWPKPQPEGEVQKPASSKTPWFSISTRRCADEKRM